MTILPRSAPLSHVSFAPFTLRLPAPPERKALPPPKIAGLLPARAGLPAVEIVFSSQTTVSLPISRREIEALIGPIRSSAQMDADIVDILLGYHPARTGKERLQ